MAETAYDRVTRALSRVTGYAANGNRNWRCPAHADDKASLTVTQADDKVLVHCHGGCEVDQVLDALGVEASDLFDESLEATQAEGEGEWTPRGPATAIYSYVDEDGALLYAVCRTAGKEFPVRRPDASKRHGWAWNLPPEIRRVLYRLPRVMGAVMAGEVIYVVEGEKDVHSIERAGAAATCNPGGAGKWREEYTKAFAGAKVRIVADLDDAAHHFAGQRHARRVASELGSVATSVETLAPAQGKDVTDHLRAGLGLDELRPLGDDDAEPEPLEPQPIDDEEGDGPRWFHTTDYGNAERLATAHGSDLRYCYDWNCWLAWDGRRWDRDNLGEAVRRAKATVRAMYAELPLLKSSKRKLLGTWAVRSEADARISSMLRLASSEAGIPVAPDELDADPWLLNVQNGTVDLHTGELRPHNRSDLITKLAPVDWDPDADWDRWAEFLDRITGSRSDLAAFIQRAAGYSLTGSTREQVFFMCHGGGSNGKTTFIETMTSLLGDYAQQTPADTLLERRDSAIPNDVARLRGARFISAVEAAEGRRLAEDLVKRLTGGDKVSARFMRGEFFDFNPVGKIWLATNRLPRVRGTDEAMWRRIRLVPFTVTIGEVERDRDLAEKLRTELAGVLQWAVLGCLEWQRRGLGVPAEVSQATLDYRDEQDIIGPFIAERCIVVEGAMERAANLYSAYKAWAESSAEQPVQQRTFGERLSERNFLRRRYGKQQHWHWVGLRLARGDELLESDGV